MTICNFYHFNGDVQKDYYELASDFLLKPLILAFGREVTILAAGNLSVKDNDMHWVPAIILTIAAIALSVFTIAGLICAWKSQTHAKNCEDLGRFKNKCDHASIKEAGCKPAQIILHSHVEAASKLALDAPVETPDVPKPDCKAAAEMHHATPKVVCSPVPEIDAAYQNVPAFTTISTAPPFQDNEKLKNEFQSLAKELATPISVSIATIPQNLQLSEDSLGELFKLANLHTLEKPYPISVALFQGIFPNERYYSTRYNHNGTHCARQVRLLEVLFELVTQHGSEKIKKEFMQLSNEEKINLKLAAYFLRSGRIAEGSHTNGDDFCTRSALIYEAYAKQLKVSPNIIEWIKVLMINSVKPKLVVNAVQPKWYRVAKEIDEIPKNLMCHELLAAAHELDLFRCFEKERFEKNCVNNLKTNLGNLLEKSDEQISKYLDKLQVFSIKLLDATGCKIIYRGQKHYHRELFQKCSEEGDHCWEVLKAIPNNDIV